MPERLEIWGVNDPNISAQLALAARLDLFKQETGLDVSCKFIESGTTMPTDVLKAEKKPFAFTQTPITALLLHDNGLSTKLLAPLADIAGTQQMIIRESSNIAHPKDLETKRVGMAQGSAVFIAVKNMAHDCDVNLDTVQFVHLLPHDQLAAFESEELDAIACWEPWTTKARTMGGKFYFSGTQSEIPGMEGNINWLINQSCLIVPDQHLEQRPEYVTAVLTVLRKATDLINADRKEVSKELAGFFGISRVELIMAMQKNRYSMSIDNLFRIGVLGFRDFLYDNGRVSSKFSEHLLYDSTFLRQVDPSLVLFKDTAAQDITIVERDGIYYRENVTLYPSGSQLRFLLADDSRFMRTTLARVVKDIGGEVVGEATTGDEAIDMFARLRPNVVTMDLSMPGVSGIEAIQGIFHTDPTASIIVISGIEMQELREQVFNLGIKMFITKPFNPKEVTAILSKQMSMKE